MVTLVIMWLANMYPVLPAAGDYLRDVNGVLVTVGATVKLVGVVTAINTFDSHFGTIQVAPLHPTGASVPSQSRIFPQSPNFAVPDQNQPVKTYGFESLQLVVGS